MILQFRICLPPDAKWSKYNMPAVKPPQKDSTPPAEMKALRTSGAENRGKVARNGKVILCECAVHPINALRCTP
eukprot:4935702-Amphidinium_carterae.1